VTLHLVLALLVFTPQSELQKRVRELEGRLRQFPPAELIADNFDFSRQHLRWLQATGPAIPFHRREAHHARLTEAKRLHGAWWCLSLATRRLEEAKELVVEGRKDNRSIFNKYCPQTVEELLEEAERYICVLENLLGDANFRSGVMPPPVPVWRFQWID
jgi:hypothetical protein